MRKLWKKKEKDDAKSFGGREQPRSGAGWKNKQDVKTDMFLIENKTTIKKSFSVKHKYWKEIKTNAVLEGRMPLLSIRFLEDDTDLVVLDKDDLIELIG